MIGHHGSSSTSTSANHPLKAPNGTSSRAWVFGYGSLTDLGALARYLGRPPFRHGEFVHCHLEGWRRRWNVARDNSRDVPGSGHYRDPRSGERPPVMVTFLNIERQSSSRVNGVAFQVDRSQLRMIRRRESTYVMAEISRWLDTRLPGAVFGAVALPAAIERCHSARATGQARVTTTYRQHVETAFRAHGDSWWGAYLDSTDDIDIPVVDLERVAPEPPRYRPLSKRD